MENVGEEVPEARATTKATEICEREILIFENSRNDMTTGTADESDERDES